MRIAAPVLAVLRINPRFMDQMCLNSSILNVNNIRDMESDAKAGKLLIPVRIGLEKARVYLWLLY